VSKEFRTGPVRKLGNLFVSFLLRVGLAPKGLQMLTTRGCRSGLPRSNPVYLIEFDGRRWLVAPYGEVSWVRNARESGRVGISKGSSREELIAEEVGAREAAPVLRKYLRRVPVVRPYFDVSAGAPAEDFEAEAARHPVFRLLSG
jgi:deazaflavin-dependent oxidoreductase (nitroreductase family)